MPLSNLAASFYPMELEIKYLPLEEKTVTTISGAPDRRAGGDMMFDDGIRLPDSYFRPGGPTLNINLRDHTLGPLARGDRRSWD
jgi:hypothetical protein